ncbi:hypothetical protein [Rhizobium lusitanum]|uniref:hypothetical protein n=1 Tax=Rhizobium lusitanum TaxID=293958 RepID=UPI001574A4BC|nr:hypothetical protein [Rhizobium lusitanum]NTJ11595.1 hypothetical protein [Rhizobium lusitanum]
MELRTQGIFWAGGEVVDRILPDMTADKILRNQIYVEYFIPNNLTKNAVPIILAHNLLSGVVWRTTPDGREGWAEYFVRRGYPVFVVDPPGTGRAGFDIDDINLAATGKNPPVSSDPLWRSSSSAWTRWSIGPEFGKVPDGGQFPTDDLSMRHYLAALLPGRSVSNEVADAAFIAATEKVNQMVGPAVFIGWSLAAGTGQRMAVARPDLFRALVLLEGGAGLPAGVKKPPGWYDTCHLNSPNPPTDIVDTLVSKKLPLLSVNGQANHSENAGHSKEVGQILVDLVNAAGGNATNIFLPDQGITGNSHMFFWENNSDQIAGIVANWVESVVTIDSER